MKIHAMIYVDKTGKKKLQKPATYVGNTIFMIDKILFSNVTNENVYYLADYPDYTILYILIIQFFIK